MNEHEKKCRFNHGKATVQSVKILPC